METNMPQETMIPNPLFTKGPQSILERTFVAEYLLIKGYLVSDLDSLHPEVASALLKKACKFSALRLADMEFINTPPWEIHFSFSLN